jgi:ATP-dependent DNA helicase RecG
VRPGVTTGRPTAARSPAGASRRAPAAKSSGRTIADQLAKLGIASEQDLVLHLPLRYEDHTRIVPLDALAPGSTMQAEGSVLNTDVHYRPRRQLVSLLGDGDARLVLRFFHFYPSQQKTLAPGKRVRVFGEVRSGHFGLEMVHPQFKVVEAGAPLADRLTPVYPTTAGLSQDTLRKAIARTLASDPALTEETLPEWLVQRLRAWKFGDAVRFLHGPPPRLNALTQRALDERTHPAWTRLKFRSRPIAGRERRAAHRC